MTIDCVSEYQLALPAKWSHYDKEKPLCVHHQTNWDKFYTPHPPSSSRTAPVDGTETAASKLPPEERKYAHYSQASLRKLLVLRDKVELQERGAREKKKLGEILKARDIAKRKKQTRHMVPSFVCANNIPTQHTEPSISPQDNTMGDTNTSKLSTTTTNKRSVGGGGSVVSPTSKAGGAVVVVEPVPPTGTASSANTKRPKLVSAGIATNWSLKPGSLSVGSPSNRKLFHLLFPQDSNKYAGLLLKSLAADTCKKMDDKWKKIDEDTAKAAEGAKATDAAIEKAALKKQQDLLYKQQQRQQMWPKHNRLYQEKVRNEEEKLAEALKRHERVEQKAVRVAQRKERLQAEQMEATRATNEMRLADARARVEQLALEKEQQDEHRRQQKEQLKQHKHHDDNVQQQQSGTSTSQQLFGWGNTHICGPTNPTICLKDEGDNGQLGGQGQLGVYRQYSTSSSGHHHQQQTIGGGSGGSGGGATTSYKYHRPYIHYKSSSPTTNSYHHHHYHSNVDNSPPHRPTRPDQNMAVAKQHNQYVEKIQQKQIQLLTEKVKKAEKQLKKINDDEHTHLTAKEQETEKRRQFFEEKHRSWASQVQRIQQDRYEEEASRDPLRIIEKVDSKVRKSKIQRQEHIQKIAGKHNEKLAEVASRLQTQENGYMAAVRDSTAKFGNKHADAIQRKDNILLVKAGFEESSVQGSEQGGGGALVSKVTNKCRETTQKKIAMEQQQLRQRIGSLKNNYHRISKTQQQVEEARAQKIKEKREREEQRQAAVALKRENLEAEKENKFRERSEQLAKKHEQFLQSQKSEQKERIKHAQKSDEKLKEVQELHDEIDQQQHVAKLKEHQQNEEKRTQATVRVQCEFKEEKASKDEINTTKQNKVREKQHTLHTERLDNHATLLQKQEEQRMQQQQLENERRERLNQQANQQQYIRDLHKQLADQKERERAAKMEERYYDNQVKNVARFIAVEPQLLLDLHDEVDEDDLMAT